MTALSNRDEVNPLASNKVSHLLTFSKTIVNLAVGFSKNIASVNEKASTAPFLLTCRQR